MRKRESCDPLHCVSTAPYINSSPLIHRLFIDDTAAAVFRTSNAAAVLAWRCRLFSVAQLIF